MVAIVDYGVGNLFSLQSSFAAIGADVAVTADPEVLKAADRIKSYTRLRLPKKMDVAEASAEVEGTWDEGSSSLLLTYNSIGDEVTVVLK